MSNPLHQRAAEPTLVENGSSSHPQAGLSSQLLSLSKGVTAATHQPATPPAFSGPLPLSAQLPRGRLIQLVDGPGRAPLTTAVSCLRYAQQRGETTAWIQVERGRLFPPDLAASGIDLDALVVIHVPVEKRASGLLKACELLLRSGGFGMVVVDLSQSQYPRSYAWQGRLLNLAREHNSWLLLIGPERQEGSLGPLVSLSIASTWNRLSQGQFLLEHDVRKDKSALLGPLIAEHRRGPDGLS